MIKHIASATMLCLALVGQSPQDDRIVISSYVPPSGELADFAAAADAIALVRIVSVKSWSSEVSRRPFVEYTAVVQDLIKSHEKFSGLGLVPQNITFLEAAGEMSTARGKVKSTNPPALDPQEDAVVFLKWTAVLDHFQLWSGPHGIYKVKGGEVRAQQPRS
jgi:hypothetical protein